MDGVIAKYERDAYTSPKSRWLRDGYFLGLEKDEYACKLLEIILSLGVESYLVTKVADIPKRNSMILDKLKWITRNLDKVDIGTQVIITKSDKSGIMEAIKERNLTKTDILIDDYNPNLKEWERNGGTAIKYLNGINSKNSWKGYSFSDKDDLTEVLQFILVTAMRDEL